MATMNQLFDFVERMKVINTWNKGLNKENVVQKKINGEWVCLSNFDLNELVETDLYRIVIPVDGHSSITMSENWSNPALYPETLRFFGIRGLLGIDRIKYFLSSDSANGVSHFELKETTLMVVYGDGYKSCIGFLFGEVINDIMNAGNKIIPSEYIES